MVNMNGIKLMYKIKINKDHINVFSREECNRLHLHNIHVQYITLVCIIIHKQ